MRVSSSNWATCSAMTMSTEAAQGANPPHMTWRNRTPATIDQAIGYSVGGIQLSNGCGFSALRIPS